MPNGTLRSIKPVEGGYCPDTRYEGKLFSMKMPNRVAE